MDAAVKLPLIDVERIPVSVRQTLPFLCNNTNASCGISSSSPSTPRVYAVAVAVAIMPKSSSSTLSSAAETSVSVVPTAEPSLQLLLVTYDKILLCGLGGGGGRPNTGGASGGVGGGALSSSSLQTVISLLPTQDRTSLPTACSVEELRAVEAQYITRIELAKDDPTFFTLFLTTTTSSSSGCAADHHPPECPLLLQIPVLRDNTGVIETLRTLTHYHRRRELDVRCSAQLRDLRSSWLTWWSRQMGADGSVILRVPVTCMSVSQLQCQTRSLQADLVVDRMRRLKEEYTATEDNTNAAIAEVNKELERVTEQLEHRLELMDVDDKELQKWSRELDVKESGLVVSESELRRAKDAAYRVKMQREQVDVTFTEELQGWRKVLSQSQSQELQARSAVMMTQERCQQSIRDSDATIQELEEQRFRLERAIQLYEEGEYASLLQQRNSLLSTVRDKQNAMALLERREGKTIHSLIKKLEMQSKDVRQTNSALRKLISTSAHDVATEETAQKDLRGDQKNIADDIVALSDASILVDLELAQAQRELDTLRKESHSVEMSGAVFDQTHHHHTITSPHHDSGGGVVRTASELSSSSLLDDPSMRYRIAKLRAARAQKEREALEKSAARTASVQHSITTDLQQQLLYEAVRLRSASRSFPHDDDHPHDMQYFATSSSSSMLTHSPQPQLPSARMEAENTLSSSPPLDDGSEGPSSLMRRFDEVLSSIQQ